MGIAGDNYVKANYDWDVVMQGFEETLVLAAEQFNKRRLKLRP
jgi:hypothetical protein